MSARLALELTESHPRAPLSLRLAASEVLEREDIDRLCQAPYAHEDEMRQAIEAERLRWAARRIGYQRAA